MIIANWKSERERIDLAALIAREIGPASDRRGGSGRSWWCCPFHPDKNPSLTLNPDGAHWRCFGCGVSGDAIDFILHRYPGLKFAEAVAHLTGGSIDARKALTRPATKPKPPPQPSGMPEVNALALVEDSSARLWTPEGANALAYLTGPRCLTSETIRSARLGWTPGAELPTKNGRTWRASGVVIPYFVGPQLALVKIRQLDNRQPKYAEAYRDPDRLVCYPGPATVRPGRPLVVVEGEFDALCLGEALGELAAVVTLGSASSDPSAALRLMLSTPRLFVATDNDAAGDKADRFPGRANRVRPPSPYKDWTEARADGVNLAQWWRDVLNANPRHPLLT